VTDTDTDSHRKTDRQTRGHSIYRASIASRGKMCAIPEKECERGDHLPFLGRQPVDGYF